MANGDQSERVAIAQALMADVTVRLEDLAGLAADLQLSLNSSPACWTGSAQFMTSSKHTAGSCRRPAQNLLEQNGRLDLQSLCDFFQDLDGGIAHAALNA